MKKILPILAIIILSYFAIKPFFLPWFFPIHDDTQVQRVFEMHKSLSDGMFPVRWVSDLGYNYGYPIFNFYAPLSYYLGAALIFFGTDVLIATKIMMVLGIILSGIFMYLLAKEFWGKAGGLISAALYLYAPYHALDIYVRGDVAEYYAYAFIPLIFLGIYKVFLLLKENSKLKTQNKEWVWICVASISYACAILSHNLTAMMVTPFILLFLLLMLLLSKDKKMFLTFSSCFLLLALSLSAFYWLPVFSEMKYTNVLSQVGGGADFKDHFVCPLQLWDSPWGFGGSTVTCMDGLSFKIGKLHVLFFLTSLFSLLFFLKKDPSADSGREKFWIGIFSVSSILFATFLTLNYSLSLWNLIPQMAFFQYPWRFLIIIVFFISFIGGSIVIFFKKLPRLFYTTIVLAVVLIIVFFNKELFMPQTIFSKSAKDYTNDYHLRWTTSKISDEYMPIDFYKPKNPNEIPNNPLSAAKDIEIISQNKKTQRIDAKILAKKESELFISLAYFPAWQIYIDGKKSEYNYSDKGLLVKVPQGEHTISIRFTQTNVEKLGNILSLTGVFILILGIINALKTHEKAI